MKGIEMDGWIVVGGVFYLICLCGICLLVKGADTRRFERKKYKQPED
jgi:hypothetical protein